MKLAIKHLRHSIGILHKDPDHEMHRLNPGIVEDLEKAISLLEGMNKMHDCGECLPDDNAALHDLGHSLSVHTDMANAFHGTPKGDYHLRCIRQIEDAITMLRNV